MLNLREIETAAYGRGPGRIRLLLKVLNELAVAPPLPADQQLPVYTRLAAAMGAILTDPQLTLGPDDMADLFSIQAKLTNLLQASGFRGSNHLAGLLPDHLQPLVSIDTAVDLDLNRMPARAGDLALVACLTALSTLPLLTAQGERRREACLQLIANGELGEIPAKMGSVMLATNGWMLCSYALGADKHAIKQTLNRAFRDLQGRLGLAAGPQLPRTPLKARPTLVFCAEVINSAHVQYRYYGQYLRQLRSRFRLVLVAPDSQVDAAVPPLFDQVVTFAVSQKGEHLYSALNAIRAAQPDILFWPSLGMSNWGPVLANMRLAPIQVVAIGHPASTFIPEMDYMLLEEGFVDDPTAFSERLILLPDQALRLEPSPGYRPVTPQIRAKAEPLRIALPCSLMKLNPSFVALLGRIRDRAAQSGRRVEYHLFPNAPALQVAAFRAEHDPRLGTPVIHPSLALNAYLEAVNLCDMALSPFPFGGFHSVIDGLRQGLPVVAMDAPSNPVKTDRMLLRLLELPDWLVASNEDAYEAAALRIILDDELRVTLSQQALDTRIDQRLFADGTRPLRAEVADAMWAIYQHHEAIQASPARALRMPELAKL